MKSGNKNGLEMEERDTDELDSDLQQIKQLLWKKRFFIVGVILVIGALTTWNLVSAEIGHRNEEREREGQVYGEFSSANLNRVERGVYRLRVEVFGNHEGPRREDTYIDFDRDLVITIYEDYGHVLAFNVENLREDIEIVEFVLRGRLRNRERNYRINLVNVQTDYLSLGYRAISPSLPISIHIANEYHEIELNNFDWLNNMEEFRNYFELTFFQVTFYMPELTDEKLQVRYMASSNVYETRVGAEIDEIEDEDGESEEIDE